MRSRTSVNPASAACRSSDSPGVFDNLEPFGSLNMSASTIHYSNLDVPVTEAWAGNCASYQIVTCRCHSSDSPRFWRRTRQIRLPVILTCHGIKFKAPSLQDQTYISTRNPILPTGEVASARAFSSRFCKTQAWGQPARRSLATPQANLQQLG